MVDLEHVFVGLVLLFGIVAFGLPFVGGPATITVSTGIEFGVAFAWAATLLIPLLIVAHQFSAIGGGT